MKSRKIIGLLAMLTVLSSFASMALNVYAAENSATPAENVSQIIGDGNTVVFVDVPNGYWAKDQIEYFARQGIVAGYEDGSFRPDAGVTREEFCKLLVSTFKQPLQTPQTPTFADVPTDRWSYPYIEVCRDFLTGYANPFGGLPTFHPAEYATREDIAVALVRMMGFTDSDANDRNYAAWVFSDGADISPNLLPYVSIACEKGLISGYPDGTFGPTRGITRAETVSLLNRATKQAVTNINAELEMSANVIYSEDGKTATVNIIAEEGTAVTVNGESVKMSSNYYGEYEGNYVYKFEEEGSKEFVVEGKKAGKIKTINVTAEYEIGAPTLTLNQGDQTVTDKDFTVSGKATDANYSVAVTINGASVNVDYYGNWSKRYELSEGENTFEVIATNENGKQTKKSVTVTYNVGAPTLTLNQGDQTVTDKYFTVSGKATDANYSVAVTINGESVNVNYYGNWSKQYELSEGENTFEVIATNENGKQTKKSVTVTYNVGAPTLTLNQGDQTVTDKYFTVSGKATDANYSVAVTINGESVNVNYYGNWSKQYELSEGENIFEVVATNEKGKQTKKNVAITLKVGDPEIRFINCPESTANDRITVKGKIEGNNEGAMLFINDEEAYVNYSGEFSETLDLNEGANTFTFRVVNDYGKEVTETKTITYIP